MPSSFLTVWKCIHIRNNKQFNIYASSVIRYIGCSERRLIGHEFHRRNFLRKSCVTCREKCLRAAPRTEKSDMPAQ
jgi:hypothetical protein